MSRHGGTSDPKVRVLIVPGLDDSGAGHWQSHLQRGLPGAVRVRQDDWSTPSLDRWVAGIDAALARAGPGPWIAVAHSFGCLGLLAWLQDREARAAGACVQAGLLVAPADPLKFGIGSALARGGAGLPTTLVASRSDPWMSFDSARDWSEVWGSRFVDRGDAGHINVASGHGPWPFARRWVDRQTQALHRERRLDRAHPMELSFAV